jgi:hypothetical protein
MSNTRSPDGKTNQPRIYQIRIQGHLGRQWAAQFEGLSMTLNDDGTTLLAGAVVDQAALHSILRRIRDLGITLISVNAITGSSNDLP